MVKNPLLRLLFRYSYSTFWLATCLTTGWDEGKPSFGLVYYTWSPRLQQLSLQLLGPFLASDSSLVGPFTPFGPASLLLPSRRQESLKKLWSVGCLMWAGTSGPSPCASWHISSDHGLIFSSPLPLSLSCYYERRHKLPYFKICALCWIIVLPVL